MEMKKTFSPSSYILDTSREYALYVCETRSIPKVIDGLKDGQRKALWLIKNKNEKIKTISLAGELISSNLYYHGDASAASSISMLAAPYCNNVPLLEGIGTFGTRIAPTEWAAPRYTYVKKNKVTEKLMFQDLALVPLKDNYDGSTKEPVHFLPLIPTVLLNGVSGIAVGWSTEILPRSLDSLIQATLTVLDGKKLNRVVPCYDYLTCNIRHIEENSWEFSGKVEIQDSSTLLITELPPDLTLEKIKDRLNTMEDEGKINSYTDKSTKTIHIVVKMARGSIKDWTEERAIEYFKLKQRKSERIVVVDWNNNSIRQYNSAEDLITDFVNWRLTWYEKRYKVFLASAQYDLTYWKSLKACFDDNFSKRFVGHKSKQEMVDDVTKLLQKKKITVEPEHIDKIVSLPSYRWAADYYNDIETQINSLEELSAEYQDILAKPEKQKAIYRSEIMELKKL